MKVGLMGLFLLFLGRYNHRKLSPGNNSYNFFRYSQCYLRTHPVYMCNVHPTFFWSMTYKLRKFINLNSLESAREWVS